jgi:hypothetical protein
MPKTYNLNTEHQEQRELFKWAELSRGKHPELANMFAVPNGGWRHPVTAAKLQAEGVKPGVPDIVLAHPSRGYPGLFIEMKRRVGGRVSDSQKEWHVRLSRAGYSVVTCKGWEEARTAIINYLTPERE